jgi:hypothetical protein
MNFCLVELFKEQKSTFHCILNTKYNVATMNKNSHLHFKLVG